MAISTLLRWNALRIGTTLALNSVNFLGNFFLDKIGKTCYIINITKGENMDKKSISNVCFVASLVSVAASIAAWALMGGDDPAHAERFGIFIGLWAPTLMGLSNYYKE